MNDLCCKIFPWSAERIFLSNVAEQPKITEIDKDLKLIVCKKKVIDTELMEANKELSKEM